MVSCYNMCMPNIKPYTYIITNEITGHWYIGKKTANEVPAIEDITYWGSSNYLKDLIKEIPEGWTKTIIAEYESDDETGLAEEKLIKEHWDLPGRVNRCKGQGKGCDFNDPEVKAKHLAAIRAACATPEFRAKRSEFMKNEPEEVKKKRIDTCRTPEHRAKKSEIAKKQHATESEEVKKKRKARAKVIIATCIATKEEFEMQGNKEMKKYNFDQASVRSCCSGKYSKTNIYKGHSFRYKI